MRFFPVFLTGMLAICVSCHKSKEKSTPAPTPTAEPTPTPEPGPTISLGLQGGLQSGGINWVLPPYLEGKYEGLDSPIAQGIVNVDFSYDGRKEPVRVYADLAIESCKDLENSIAMFVDTVAKSIAVDNLPEEMKIDTGEISSWTIDSKNLKGRAIFKKRYKAEGNTGVYRMAALLVDEKNNQCLEWNVTLSPINKISVSYIENSAEYLQLVESLVATWKGVGANFAE